MSPHRRIATLPNVLTMARILCVPFFVWAAVQETLLWQYAALALFLLASLTDLIDGQLARRRNQITDFGKLADPIADKALTGAAFILFSLQGVIPWWVTLLILAREWSITVARLVVRNRVVHAANAGGKLKTTLQITGISLVLYPADGFLGWLLHPAGIITVWAAMLVTVWTGLLYVRELRRV